MVSLVRALCILVLLSSLTLQAGDNLNLAISSLRHQVNIIHFATHDELFASHLDTLDNEPAIGQLQPIINDVRMFWQSQQIPLRDRSTNLDEPSTDTILSQVLGSEPALEDYLAVSNRIRYLSFASAQYDWQPISPGGWFKLGDAHRSIPQLRTRLAHLSENSAQDLNNVVFDEALEQSVVSFQRRHGLEPDGVVGPATLRWLNTTAYQRATIIAEDFVNRSSYLASVGQRYLLINIPAYEMVLVDSDQVVLNSRVIVGKPYRKTPLLQSQISNMVLNPTWRVPRKLLKRDLLPKVGADGSYISEGKFQVYNRAGDLVVKSDQEWQDLAFGDFPYRLVQQAGESNTLGRYKFFFENSYNVYLHDTLDTELFERSDRALSSGCIRVEKIEQLANWMAANLVKDKQTWVEMQDDRNTTQWFSLHQTLPVHLVYWTSWVGKQNKLQFRTDIYKRHQKLSLELASQ